MTTTPLWTLDELGERVRDALAASDYVPARSARVRAVPDRRTIRYYTTLGLIDRPAELRGRTAYYGPRHLQQLVAVKRLQADGLSLAEVQERLAGVTDADLRRLADVPTRGAPAPQEPSPREAFWAAEPAALEDYEHAVMAPTPAASGPQGRATVASSPDVAGRGRTLTGVRLARGVTLLLDADALDDDDLAALQRAAAPLLAELAVRGIPNAGS